MTMLPTVGGAPYIGDRSAAMFLRPAPRAILVRWCAPPQCFRCAARFNGRHWKRTHATTIYPNAR